jgi:hypothetical protein
LKTMLQTKRIILTYPVAQKSRADGRPFRYNRGRSSFKFDAPRSACTASEDS